VINSEDDDKYIIPIHSSDVLFTLALNKSIYKEKVRHLTGKILIMKESTEVNLLDISRMLHVMKINKMHIFSINGYGLLDSVPQIQAKERSTVNYIEIGAEDFTSHLNNPDVDFLNYNANSLYILRGGSYIDVKNIFTKIRGCEVNVGRGGSQKSHVISPLDFRLSCYLLALFNFNYKYIHDLNAFNGLSKDRYLVYKENPLIRHMPSG